MQQQWHMQPQMQGQWWYMTSASAVLSRHSCCLLELPHAAAKCKRKDTADGHPKTHCCCCCMLHAALHRQLMLLCNMCWLPAACPAPLLPLLLLLCVCTASHL
jgi:hypothetical protein